MSYDIGQLPRQDGRIVMVTGSNTGLGFHNAHDLAAKGAKVVMACRTESRATDAMRRITELVPDADLEFLALDLSSLDAVRSAAATFRDRHDTLDVLVNNAGIMMTPYEKTVDGFEGQMAANYWGHFLLTMSLIDLMPDAPESRVVSLSSLAHAQGTKKIRFDDIHWEQKYSRSGAYQQTKLACLLFALELDRRLRAAGKEIVSVASHPGVSPTELGRAMPKLLTEVVRYTVGPFVSHDPDVASLPSLVAAIDPEVSGGEYYGPQGLNEMKGDPGPARIHPCAHDVHAARQLWDLSVELTGADLPFDS
ncbi:MAG: SDR family NAD(P)-dependent oxidoreductase [Acidimicrobiales bacterium]|nr:SDR family NAD(P)-dependent oxidoreductase [Acidimicrobiia bacterium]NNC79372.1 SDR family NAD(P)-dependent oxidoreductase [Acidimicrobiales bacterium]RZV45206.1 MAG: SDR family NAD(P)-dependent oxidoreductase [Acidimicrobiales bacterium]